MAKRSVPERFQVAFSLAGEQRSLVRAVAEELERRIGRSNVFYDDWYEFYLAGNDADLKLQDIYGERAELVVLCVSSEYGKKPWTQTEHAAIRARYMQALASDADEDRERIMPLRFGDGEVRGIPSNTIAPDVRERPAADVAELIIDRLNSIRTAGAEPPAATADWPVEPPTLRWPMADHTQARAAFGELLTRDAPFRFLPIRGPTDTGKTHVSKQMLANALRVDALRCGRFDFKGTAGMDAEVRTFSTVLGLPVPPVGDQLSERLGPALEALQRSREPTLLVFDTYEAAGEASQWVERDLLTGLIRSAWLRVVVLGQSVPEPGNAVWESIASPTIQLSPPGPEDWYDFGLQHKPDVTLDFVRQAHHHCQGRVSVLSSLLGPPQ